MFEGYKVAITGATSGIGLATAKAFLADGATVIGIGRHFKNTADLGDNFIPFKCDVTDMEQVKAACEFIDETFGGVLDVFVNNAGASVEGKFTPTEAQFDYGIGVLLKAPVFFCNMLHPLLAKSTTGNANIVHVASAAAYSHNPPILTYALAKGAHLKLARIQTNAWDDVRVNVVCPGHTYTNIFSRSVSVNELFNL